MTRRHMGIAVAAGVMLFVLLASAVAADGVIVRKNPRRYRCRVEVVADDIWKEKLGLLFCLSYPESDAFQDVEFVNHTPGSVEKIPGHGDDKYFRIVYSAEKLAEMFPDPESDPDEEGGKRSRRKKREDEGPKPRVGVYQEFFTTLYDFDTDFDKITHIYPYDETSELYRTYTAAEAPFIEPDNPQIVAVAQEIADTAEENLEFARLAFRYAKNEVPRAETQGRRQPLAQTLKRGGAGANINAVFVSILRSAGIPARLAVVRRVNNTAHCWAEFYLEKYGWIPADPSINVRQDVFFGQVRLPQKETRSKSQALGLIINHVYSDFELPVPVETAQPLQASSFREALVWGVYTRPRYKITMTEVDPLIKQDRTPFKQLKMPLR